MTCTARLEGDDVVVRIPIAQAHSLCVALEECPCKMPKSNSTKDIRQRLKTALSSVTARRPVKCTAG